MQFSRKFSPDYLTARSRFREAAIRLGWALEGHSIGKTGPTGEDLTIDVASFSRDDMDRTLVVSSGVHGVEGFFGSAVQLSLMERWAVHGPPSVRCLFLHGLNPYGFAWLRRFNEDNIDPNRNFLLPGELYQGAPSGYAGLDGLLNPRQPPSRWESFILKALPAILRHGMPELRQSVAAGQYEFPKGLFFGGHSPCMMQRILKQNLGRWLEGSACVVHLDFHTGLGASGEGKLLIDNPLSPASRKNLTDWFGADSFEACDSSGISYDARGGFGRWCVAQEFAPEYLFACAEFGTFGPIKVLTGLRAENQAHHWGLADSNSTHQAKLRLKDLFCPSSPAWRSRVLAESMKLADQAIEGLKRPFRKE